MNQRMDDLLSGDRPPLNQLEKAWVVFHRLNPHVYQLFDKFTRQATGRGIRSLGQQLVWERMRWYLQFETTEQSELGSGYKLNNNHTAYYSRLWMERNPEHKGMFKTRAVRVDPWIAAGREAQSIVAAAMTGHMGEASRSPHCAAGCTFERCYLTGRKGCARANRR